MISTCYTCCLPKFHKQEKIKELHEIACMKRWRTRLTLSAARWVNRLYQKHWVELQSLYLAGLFTPRYSRDYIPCSPCICWRHCIQPAGGNHRKSRQIMHTASNSIWNAKQLESEPPVYPALIFSGSLELACLSISISGQARNP